VVSDYAGTAALTSSVGSAAPSNISFGGGVWEGSVAIAAETGSNCTLSAQDSTIPASGTSDAFALRLKGDADGGGTVNVLDVVRSVNLALGDGCSEPPRCEFQLWAADMNCDQGVNVLDVVQIVNRSLGVVLAAGVQRVSAPAPPKSAGPVGVSLSRQSRDTWALRLNSAAGMAGLQAEIRCDDRIGPARVETGPLLAGAGWTLQYRSRADAVEVVAYHPSSRALADAGGVALLLHFEGGEAANGAGRRGVSLVSVLLSDSRGAELPAIVQRK